MISGLDVYPILGEIGIEATALSTHELFNRTMKRHPPIEGYEYILTMDLNMGGSAGQGQGRVKRSIAIALE